MTSASAEWQALQQAVQLAQSGDWHGAHDIAQVGNSPQAHWLHAVLHKMEGDAANSRYWYARSAGQRYETFGADSQAELAAIAATLLEQAG